MRRLRSTLILGVSLALLSFQVAQATPLLTSKWRNYYWNGHNNTVWYCFNASFPGGNYSTFVPALRTSGATQPLWDMNHRTRIT